MRWIVLIFLPLLTGAEAHAQPAPLFCGLDPAIEEKLCQAENESDSLCGWLPILADLAGGNFDTAEVHLAALFTIEQPLAARLLPLLGLALRPLDTDVRCLDLQGGRFLRKYQDAGYPGCKTRDPDHALFIAYMLATPPELISLIEEEVDATLRPQVARVGVSFRKLLEVLPYGSVPPRHFREQEFFEGIELGPLEAGYVSTREAEELRQIELALAELAGGKTAEGQRRLSSLVAKRPPLVAIRAAFALGRAGFLLEAQPLLGRAQAELARLESSEPLNLYSTVLAGWLEAWVLMELGQPAESLRALEKIEAIEDKAAGDLLEILPRPNPAGIGSVAFKNFDTPALLELRQKLKGTPYHAALAQALESMSPSVRRGEVRALEHDAAPSELDIWLHFHRKNWDEALVAAEAFIARHPKYRYIKVFLLLAVAYGAEIRRTEAREVLERAVSLLEEKLGHYQDDELARSFIDSQVHGFFATAVELASLWGREGWSYAERARAFSLRRLLGDIRRKESLAEFPGQRELEESIARLERSVQPAPRQLEALYSSFESARLRQKLHQAQLQPAPAEIQSQLQLGDYSNERETYLVYFDTVGKLYGVLGEEADDTEQAFAGRLWVWLVTENGLAQLPSDLRPEDWEKVACLGRVLRWQNAGEGARRAAADRGVEILASCPGAVPGTDPAAELYRVLVAPVENLLPPGRRLVIVPHGKLNGISFAALRNPRTGRQLVEDFEVAIVPSLDVLNRLRRRGAAGDPGPLAHPN